MYLASCILLLFLICEFIVHEWPWSQTRKQAWFHLGWSLWSLADSYSVYICQEWSSILTLLMCPCTFHSRLWIPNLDVLSKLCESLWSLQDCSWGGASVTWTHFNCTQSQLTFMALDDLIQMYNILTRLDRVEAVLMIPLLGIPRTTGCDPVVGY